MGYFVAKLIARYMLMDGLRKKYKTELENQTMTERDIVNIFTDLWGAEGPDCCTQPV